MPDETEAETIRAAMGILGRIKSPAKDAARLANLEKAITTNRAKASPCDCGRTDGTHAASCPVWHRERMARYRANKAEKAASAKKE